MGAKLGGGDGSRYTTQQNADINVTPFVDIMLVLLVIFMVTLPVATASIKLDLPPAVDSPNKPKKEPVFISIQGEGQYYIKGNKTSIETLDRDLRAALQSPTPYAERIMVRAQPDVKYEEFMKVLNELSADGYYKIGLINENIT